MNTCAFLSVSNWKSIQFCWNKSKQTQENPIFMDFLKDLVQMYKLLTYGLFY